MILGIALGLALLALIGVAIKARQWDYATPLFNAQQEERAVASAAADCLLFYFDQLDRAGGGLLAAGHLAAVAQLNCSDEDKALLRYAFEHSGPKAFIAQNPWLLAAEHHYEFTAIGHVVGEHTEYRYAAVAAGRFGAVSYTVTVPDYAISKADLESYVERVFARATLGLPIGS